MIIRVPSFSFRLEILILVGLVGLLLFMSTVKSCCRYSFKDYTERIMDHLQPKQEEIEKEKVNEKEEEIDGPLDIIWYTPDQKTFGTNNIK